MSGLVKCRFADYASLQASGLWPIGYNVFSRDNYLQQEAPERVKVSMPKLNLLADFGQIFLLCVWLSKELLSQSMTTLTAHFDGKVLIPDEPVNLPVNCALELHVEPVKKKVPSPNGGKPVEPEAISSSDSVEDRPLMKLLRALEAMPDNPDAPTDGAAQHDHYLYGLPKRP